MESTAATQKATKTVIRSQCPSKLVSQKRGLPPKSRSFGKPPTTATVTISEHAVRVRFARRAHNPMMVNAGFADAETVVPWLGGRTLKLEFGP